MCTAITYQTKDFYAGRTLDLDESYSEEVTITPRRFPLPFRHMPELQEHYAIIGMAHVLEDYPLYFDAVNEKGLAIMGLNFEGYAQYTAPEPGQTNIASFELIPWLLGQCKSVAEAKLSLEKLRLTDTAFHPELPPSQLHWLLTDRHEAVTIESAADGLKVYPNPAGVLTNNPSFPEQLFQLNNFMHLSSRQPENSFSSRLSLQAYSNGMGGLGLPGDLSSQSRFVRAAFTKLNSVSGMSESESVGQFFHILETVSQTHGCCQMEDGKYEKTIYTSCCNTDKGIYYYTTYQNRQITAVNLHREKLDDSFLVRFPLRMTEQIHAEN